MRHGIVLVILRVATCGLLCAACRAIQHVPRPSQQPHAACF